MKTLIILRGTSSSGKTTFANYLDSLVQGQSVVCCADDYFYVNGKYCFEGSKLKEAHRRCKIKFNDAVSRGEENIIVANTNTEREHFEWYRDIGTKNGYMVFVVVVERYHDGKNDHNVPEHVLERQENAIVRSLQLR